MPEALSRKQFLQNSTKAVAAMAVGAGALSLVTGSRTTANQVYAAWPYPYQTLDIEVVRNYGHQAYYSGKGCCYGGFYGLVHALIDKIGEPYTSFPSEMMIYGWGGGVGYGATCGAINGAAALISLVCVKARADVLASELYGWYTQVKFPSDISNDRAVNHTFTENKYDKTLPQNISGSVLCHVSCAQWITLSTYKNASTERKERCARLTGDCAAYAAQILNDELAGKFTPLYTAPTTIAACMACHGSTVFDNVSSKSECKQCHGDPHTQSGMAELSGPPATYHLSQNYPNPFNPQTRIQFSLPEKQRVDLAIYDVHGRMVKELIDFQEYAAGTYNVDWDGMDADGRKVASGVYFSRIQAGTYSSTCKMSLVK
ncbi:MAG TPA: C-GCAxxG-C-C family (seleno)protein [Bacteroidota bacterium]|nr:C-GCAxxG-C-C family (seleno)protein [Bacteroidota bacterium]